MNIEEPIDIRPVFNSFPTKQIDILPNAVFYTPASPTENILDYDPIHCKFCESILNPACEIDFARKTWKCLFCRNVNVFPMHYKDINEPDFPSGFE